MPDIAFRGQVNRDIAATESDTDPIDVRAFRSGAVLIPDGWTTANLVFLGAPHDDSANGLDVEAQPVSPTYRLVRKADATLVKVTNINTSTGAWYTLPAEVFDHGFIKVRSANTGTDAAEAQVADRQLCFSFKS